MGFYDFSKKAACSEQGTFLSSQTSFSLYFVGSDVRNIGNVFALIQAQAMFSCACSTYSLKPGQKPGRITLKGVCPAMLAKSAFSLLLCLAILLLASCGYNGSAPTITGASQAATATPPITPGATVTANATAHTTPGASSGRVSVHISASAYRINETITVTVNNATAQTISFADHQSNCSIVLLQRQVGSSWESVGICKLMTLTRFLSMGAGKSSTVSLRPLGAWQTGNYRVAFTYSLGSIGATSTRSPATISYSPMFQVH